MIEERSRGLLCYAKPFPTLKSQHSQRERALRATLVALNGGRAVVVNAVQFSA
jgi:hypothetical protein